MGRTLEAVCKRCRREGMKLFLKGARCQNANTCAFEKNSNPPGMHGAKRGKVTDYGIHLREKQKVKTYYGVMEKQFRKYYKMADRAKGNTGKVLMGILESRLDNVVYRLGFAVSRAAARQFIGHGHILVNGRRVDIVSYLVRPGDIITVKGKKGSVDLASIAVETAASGACPDFLNVEVKETGGTKSFVGTVLRAPSDEDVSLPVDAQLIVELCSR